MNYHLTRIRRILILWTLFTALLLYGWYLKDIQNEKLVQKVRALQKERRLPQPLGYHHDIQHTLKMR